MWASPLGRGARQVRLHASRPPEVFVVGDLMSLDGLPGVAQVAIQSGRHAAATVIRRLHGDVAERPFRYRDRGTMATVSRFDAIASVGPLRMSGLVAWLLWLAVHLVALTGFKHRIAVLFNWAIAFVGNTRPQRAITTQQVFAGQVRDAQAAAVDRGAAALRSPSGS